MPIYEFMCDSCGLSFEALRNINEGSSMACSKCNTSARRIYSSIPFIFGGTRWVGEPKPKTATTQKDKSIDKKVKTAKTED
jgi:putative FmdB family regulatory protein